MSKLSRFERHLGRGCVNGFMICFLGGGWSWPMGINCYTSCIQSGGQASAF